MFTALNHAQDQTSFGVCWLHRCAAQVVRLPRAYRLNHAQDQISVGVVFGVLLLYFYCYYYQKLPQKWRFGIVE